MAHFGVHWIHRKLLPRCLISWFTIGSKIASGVQIWPPPLGSLKSLIWSYNLHVCLCGNGWFQLTSSATPNQWLNSRFIHWASKETYNFLEWCPLKSTASKWMIFWLMLATVLLITHVKKQRNWMCQKWDKCLQITTSPISKSQKLLPFHRKDFRTFQ